MNQLRPPLSTLLALLIFLCSLPGVSPACTAPKPYIFGSGCFAQCPWNGTLITYLHTPTSTCLTSCNPGTWADDSTKTCVSSCPSAPILTYYDNFYHRCVQNCSTDPARFAASDRNCVQNCPSPFFADQAYGICVSNCSFDTYYQVSGSVRRCVKICYPNFYANISRFCVAAADCKTTTVPYYADDSTGRCVQICPAGRRTFADDSTQRCVLYCPLGTFSDSVSRKCVSICPRTPQYFGSNMTRQCLLQCNQGQFADQFSYQCTAKCPVGSYGDYPSRKCVNPCPQAQGTYGDPLSRLCVSICPANYYADNYSSLCVPAISCSNATFGDPVTQKCVSIGSCSQGFYADVATGLCVVRCSTWANPLTGFCQSTCPWKPPVYLYFQDSSTNTCVKTCPVNPRTFGDNNTRTCVQVCPQGTFGSVIGMICVLTCPSGFFANDEVNICVSNCTQNSSSILYFYRPSLSCLSTCPWGYNRDNATMSCQLKCTNHTFAYIITRQCVFRCPQGYFGDPYTRSCATSCPIQNGQFADPSTNLCVDICPSNPDLFGQNINDGNKTCIEDCTIDGFYQDTVNRVCVDTCNVTDGYYGDPADGRCYARCPTGYGDPLMAQCVPVCPKAPKFYYGDNLTATCVLACPAQTYGDPTNNLCVTARNCSAGLFADDITGVCVSVCSQLLNLYGDPQQKKCVSVCSFSYYSDPVSQQCSQTCSSGLFKDRSNKRCVSTCSALPDLFNDPNSGFCEYNCTNGWFGWAYGTRRQCVKMCPANPPYLADLQNGICVLKCANGTFAFINNTFRGCLNTCPPQVLSANLTVDLFADNTTWRCVKQCPYGQYSFKHPTDPTIRLCVRQCPMVLSTYYYAQDSLRQCVTQCPRLYQQTYGDSLNFKCVKSCSRYQYKDNSTSTCVYRCPNGTFANNVTWNCSAWCQEGWFAQSINNTCVRVCPTNYYGHMRRCITQCPDNSYVWNDNTTWRCVQTCPSYPDTFADNTTDHCVLRCPPGLYGDTATRWCMPAINCTQPTIADPITGRCVLQCTKVPMYFLTIQTNLCGPSCSNSTFAYNQTNICVDQCPDPYFGVNTTVPTTTLYYCTQYCPVTLYKWVNGTTRRCIPQCPTDLYRDDLTMSCVARCPDYFYANSSNTKCVLSCAPLYADDTTKSCVPICPNGTTASNNSYKCQQYCDFGEYTLNKVCYSGCSWPLFADNLTRACVANCTYDPLTYANNVTNRCTLGCSPGQYAFLGNLTCANFCAQPFFKQLTLLLCLQTCLQGYFSDNHTLTCVTSCASSTKPFSDPTIKACVDKCPTNPDLYGHNNTCITQCPLGLFAQNFTRTCMPICPNVSSVYLNQSWADDLTRRCLARCSALSYAYINSTMNVCLNQCPVGFYASIQQQACLAKCPPGFYAHNGTRSCKDQCPHGQWADLVQRVCMPNCAYNSSLFSDDSSASCVQRCPTYPDMYADPTTGKCVLTCPSTHFAYNITRVCRTDCPAPYFADSYLLQCVRKCTIPSLAFADNIFRTCARTCVNHTINSTVVTFFQDNTTLTCVRVCPSTPQRYYGQNVTNTCVQRCPDGTYGDNDTNLCLDRCIFADPKFTWADRNSQFCVKICPYGYYADNMTGACELTCSNGTYMDFSTRRCVIKCPNFPSTYSAIVGGLARCVYNCPNGTYSSQVSVSCVTACPTTPTVYYTYGPTSACVKQCVYPYFADLVQRNCTTTCGQGYYGNLTTKVCQICQVQCTTCSGYLVCDSCISGFYLYQHTCVIICPTYPVMYFAHKQSGVCFKTCPLPFFGQRSTGLCQLTCPSIAFANHVTRTCTACPTGCITCDILGCYTCTQGYTFMPPALLCNKNCNSTAIYYFLNVCYFTCPPGSYLSYDLVTCLACSAPCATCTGTANNCTSCLNSYYYIGKCVDACPANFYIDSNNNCQACFTNPQRCILPPLTYSIHPFTRNYIFQAYVVFNRAVVLTPEKFATLVQISYAGQPIKSSQYTVSSFNSTTYLVVFSSEISALANKQNKVNNAINPTSAQSKVGAQRGDARVGNTSPVSQSLTFYFPPGSITDPYGNVLTTVTVIQKVDPDTGLNTQVVNVSTPVQDATLIITIIFLIILGLYYIKGGYPALVSIQIIQLIHLHIFLLSDPLPYLQYRFLDILRYFNLMFIPSIFPKINITTPFYQLFSTDVSFLSNSPLIILFAAFLLIYFVVMILSSKKIVSNRHVRRFFKKIRKYRLKFGLIHDAFWLTFPYAVFISMLQFKIGKFSDTFNIVNILLSIITLTIFLIFTVYVIYLGYKYRFHQDKVPKKYKFLVLQPSSSTLQIPMRYGRKLLFAAALMLPSLQSQAVMLVAINLVFLIFYLIYRPAKSVTTNKIILFAQVMLLVLTALFIAYDRLSFKPVKSQQAFAIAMLAVQLLTIVVLLVWTAYRLALVIKQTQTWKHIVNKMTQNTSPEYIRQQQRKRDLQFDFQGLDNPSQEDVTEHQIQKATKKSQLDQKFNIFDQNNSQVEQEVKVSKDKKVASKKRIGRNRPGSSQSQIFVSNDSQKKFSPHKTQNMAQKQHLQIVNKDLDNSIENISIGQEKKALKVQNQAKDKQKKDQKEDNDKASRVIWDIEFDQNEI